MSKQKGEFTKNDQKMKEIGKEIEKHFPDYGYITFIVPYGSGMRATGYTSNIGIEETPGLLREFADIIDEVRKSRGDFPKESVN